MKNRIFPIFLFIFNIFLLCGCGGNAKNPDISFVSATYDFGMIDVGDSVDHVFKFTNTGTGVLRIEGVRPTCSCTVSGNYDKEVKPGQTGHISVSFNSSGFEGQVAKPIIVRTNVPGKSDMTIVLTGIVKVSVSVNPNALSFGDIERGRTEPLEGVISISNRLSAPLKIIDVVKVSGAAKKPNITFSNTNVEAMIKTVNDGYEYSLIVTVKPPFKYGKVMGSFLIMTDSEKTPAIETNYSYYMEPLVKVFPNPLFITKDQIARGKEHVINIECEQGNDMEVVDLSVNNADVTVNLEELEKGRRYKLLLKLPKDFTFDSKNTLTVLFKAQNIPDEPIFGIPVLGM